MKSLLRTKYFNAEGEASLRGVITLGESILKFEANLRKNLGAWEYAIIYADGDKLHYYHHSTGVLKLDLDGYVKQLKATRINLYIVSKTGRKPKTVCGAKIEDMPNHYDNDVLKVIAYLNNKPIKIYQDGQFY